MTICPRCGGNEARVVQSSSGLFPDMIICVCHNEEPVATLSPQVGIFNSSEMEKKAIDVVHDYLSNKENNRPYRVIVQDYILGNRG